MTNKFSKLAVAAAGAALSVTALGAEPAQAVLVTYDYSFVIPNTVTTPPAGAVGTGFFTFDNASVDSTFSFQAIPVVDFALNLLGETFDAADSRGPVTADFFSGVFVGVAFDSRLESIPPGFSIFSIALTEPEFALFDQEFNTAVGPISYTLRPPGGVIPTPALLPGLVGLGLAAWRKRQEQTA